MKLKNNLYYVGVDDKDLKVFDTVMPTKFGTTYNAYLVKGEKTALIETVHNNFADEYISNVEKIQSISSIDYIICNHAEPDHSGAVSKLIDLNPNIQVIGTTTAIKNLKEITNLSFNERVVKDGETFDLGNGVLLKFIITPNVHWPDTMVTYYEKEKVLFSGDLFGAHYCSGYTIDNDIYDTKDYYEEFKLYYDSIMRQFNPFVKNALMYISSLDIGMICTTHGFVVEKNVSYCIEKYKKWSNKVLNKEKTAAIYYISAYGCTAKMAHCIAEGIRSENVPVRVYDCALAGRQDMIDDLDVVDGILFGSPTLKRNVAKQVIDIASSMDLININEKTVGIFGSYGWSGEASNILEQYLKNMRINIFEKPQTTIFNPSQECMDELREYGRRFARELKDRI